MTIPLKNLPVATLLCVLFLNGCATSNVQRVSFDPVARPLRVILVETPNSVDSAVLRNVFAPELPEVSDEADKLVESGMAKAQTGAMAEMQDALTNAGMKVLGSETVGRRGDESGEQQFAKELGIEQAKTLQSESGADYLLRFRISDYGQTPRAWRKWVIGFEVVTTVGIAAIAYSIPKTRPLAGAYLITEAVEETAEAYAGFWALDKLSRPVRTEAELFDLHTGKMVWADSNTGLAKAHLIRLATNINAASRNAQLKDAIHESVGNLVGRLVHSANMGELSGSGGRK